MYENLCMVALPQIQCQVHDHARQYDNDNVCHNKSETEWWKVAWQYISEWQWNAIIGRYSGYFEEDIRRFMCDRAYHITGCGCTSEVCTDSRGEKGQCTVSKKLAMMEG